MRVYILHTSYSLCSPQSTLSNVTNIIFPVRCIQKLIAATNISRPWLPRGWDEAELTKPNSSQPSSASYRSHTYNELIMFLYTERERGKDFLCLKLNNSQIAIRHLSNPRMIFRPYIKQKWFEIWRLCNETVSNSSFLLVISEVTIRAGWAMALDQSQRCATPGQPIRAELGAYQPISDKMGGCVRGPGLRQGPGSCLLLSPNYF